MEFAKTLLSNVWPEWEIIEEIGTGSFGKVYKIKREYIGDREQFSALKVIRIPSKPEDASFAFDADNNSTKEYYKSLVTNIVKEIELMSKVKGHTNIVSYEDHKVIEDENGLGWTILLRMELLMPFSQYIKTNKIGNKEATRLGIDICKALEVCKKYSIVHRDIKTENVFVSETGDFKLGDFGTARTFDKTVDMATMAGTYPYMAPEVIKQEPHGHQSDIYSLGIMLYKLLNKNRFPFYPPHPEEITHDSVQESFRKRLSGEKLPVPCDADKKLSNIILKACEYNRKDRFANAVEMRNALEEETEPVPFPWKKLLCAVSCLGIVALIATGIFFGIKHLPTMNNENFSVAGAFVAYGEEGYLEFAEYENSIEITGLLDSTCDITIPKKINGKSVTAIADNAFYYCYIENIEFPDTIETIGSRAFLGVSGLDMIELPQKLKKIDDLAFADCVNLKTVKITSSLNDVGEYAFSTCNSLENFIVDSSNKCFSSVDGVLFNADKTVLICYPPAKAEKEYFVSDSTQTILKSAFSRAKNLEKVVIPSSVKTLGESCFDSCTQLSEVVLKEGLINIEKRAFAECNLTNITIPNSVETIGVAAFYNNANLENVYVGNGAKDISYSAFAGTKWFSDQEGYIILGDGILIGYKGSDKELKVPDGVKVIENLGYNNVTNSFTLDTTVIERIDLPSSVVKICSDVFAFCTPPKTLHIPDSVKEIEDGALSHYNGLENISIDENNPYFTTDEYGVVYNKDITKLVLYPKNNQGTTYDVPSSVKKIGDFAFYYCKKLISIEFSEGLEEIGNNAFEQCSGITKIEFPSSLKSIGNEAFASCVALEQLDFSGNIKTLGDESFYSCGALQTVTIPSSIESIGEEAFSSCNKLKFIEVDEANANYKSLDGILYNREVSDLILYPAGRTDSAFSTPDTVTSISASAFKNNKNISTVTLSANVKLICSNAFQGCSDLLSINTSHVAVIGSYTFAYCESLKSITLSQRLTAICNDVFNGCKSLEIVNLPETLTYIGDRAFKDCVKLKTGTIPNRVRYMGEIAFMQTANEFINIPTNAKTALVPFYNCTSLKNIVVDSRNTEFVDIDGVVYNIEMTQLICYPAGKTAKTFVVPDTVKEIYSYAFSYNEHLEEIVLPETVELIDNNAFECCPSLRKINLNNNIKEIGERAFQNCYALSNIELPANIQSLEYGVFKSCGLESIVIPKGVTKINDAFIGCNWLRNIFVAQGNTIYKDVDGVLFSEDGCRLICYPSGKTDESYIIPQGVESVESGAFSGVYYLKNLTLSDSTQDIYDYSISSCNNLENIYVSNNSPFFTSIDGVLYNKEVTRLVIYPDGKIAKEYILPETVLYVPNNAINSFRSLEKLIVTSDKCIVETDYIDIVYDIVY